MISFRGGGFDKKLGAHILESGSGAQKLQSMFSLE